MCLQLVWRLSSRQQHRQQQQRCLKAKLQQPRQQHHVSTAMAGEGRGALSYVLHVTLHTELFSKQAGSTGFVAVLQLFDRGTQQH